MLAQTKLHIFLYGLIFTNHFESDLLLECVCELLLKIDQY